MGNYLSTYLWWLELGPFLRGFISSLSGLYTCGRDCLDTERVSYLMPQHAELQHTLDTQSHHAVEEKRESALRLPIASYSVLMGVH